jgi:hypothetical protein
MRYEDNLSQAETLMEVRRGPSTSYKITMRVRIDSDGRQGHAGVANDSAWPRARIVKSEVIIMVSGCGFGAPAALLGFRGVFGRILVFAKRRSRSNSRADAGNSYYPHPIAILGVSPGLLPVQEKHSNQVNWLMQANRMREIRQIGGRKWGRVIQRENFQWVYILSN